MKDWKQKQPLYVNGILEVVMLGSFDAGTEGATKAERAMLEGLKQKDWMMSMEDQKQ